MARETLVQARLPTFQIPGAVEVLTLGTYSRLPTCIREKIVPPDPITPSEKRTTLLRLNQIIQQRLVTSVLPEQMKNLHVENGRVTFVIPNEFELSLTLLGDGNNIPWKVLSLRILVIDRDSSESAIASGSGKDMVHPMQINFLQDLVQSRLIDNPRPLIDAYNVLHSFCLSLQLEVLNLQVYRLIRDRLKDYIRIEEYTAGKKLTISYWREYCATNKLAIPGMKLSLEIDSFDSSKPLQVIHMPDLNENESVPIGGLKSVSTSSNDTSEGEKSVDVLENLSFEKMFIHATHKRAMSLLQQLHNELLLLKTVLKMSLSGCPPTLEISYLEPCAASERLIVSVDTLTGFFLAHIPQFVDDCPLTSKFPTTLKEVAKIAPWINDLRVWIFKQRCRRTVEFLPVNVYDSLPFAPGYTHPIAQSRLPKLFFNFNKHNEYFLMASFLTPTSDESNSVEIGYDLLSVKYVSFDCGDSSTSMASESDLPKVFVKLSSVFKLDIASLTNRHIDSITCDFLPGKRKRILDLVEAASSKKLKSTAFFISELAHIISFCDDKFFNTSLAVELQRKSICHQIRVDVDPANSHYIDLVQFPPKNLFPPSQLQKDLLTASIRFSNKANKYWTVTLTFYNCPIQSSSSKENGTRKTVYLMYNFTNDSKVQMSQMVDEMLDDWLAIEKLYEVVCSFGKVVHLYSHLIEVRSFTYKKLCLVYGPGKSYSVTIHWKSLEKRFHLAFGVCGNQGGSSNPHSIVSTQLQNEFNQHKDIATLVQTLECTLEPLSAILGLSTVTQLGVITSKPNVPVNSFCWIPQTSTHIRLVYRGLFCIDVVVQADGLIAVRDGACTVFDKVKAEDLSPIPCLKAFLNLFVDRSVTQLRRPSQADDDNPPSPHIEGSSNSADQFSYASTSNNAMRNVSPAVGVNEGPSNASMRSTHMGSNPNTPASPQTSMFSQMNYNASPSGGFPMAASPHTSLTGHHGLPAPSPSLQGHAMPDQSPALFSVNSPATQMHAPSPGFLPTPSPGPQLQSPASSFLHGSHDHSQQVNSPFHPSSVSMHSPAPGGWPGSPSISRPSPGRPLNQAQSPASCGQQLPLGQSPQTPNSMHAGTSTVGSVVSSYGRNQLPLKSAVVAIPTIMTAKGFHQMCRAGPIGDEYNRMNAISQTMSPLERFLGCVSMRRHLCSTLQKSQSADGFTLLTTNEPGILSFKNETMQFRITLHHPTMQFLHVNISVADHHRNPWSPEELQILERFFESKVLSAPYKPNGFVSITKLLSSPIDVIKDGIQLMRMELVSDDSSFFLPSFLLTLPVYFAQQPDRTLNWSLQWNLTIPPVTFIQTIPGMSAIVRLQKNIMLFCFQFTRINHHLPGSATELQSTVIPFIYDSSSRILKSAIKDGQRMNPFIIKVNGILNQFYSTHVPAEPCTLAAAIHEILRHD